MGLFNNPNIKIVDVNLILIPESGSSLSLDMAQKMIANIQKIKRTDANKWLTYIESDYSKAGLFEWYEELNELTKLTYNNEQTNN